ncbi:MAG: ATP-binding cassette domain-containing protein [Candidatus Omnitrophica bacterium]|nr:ATP-binding cassette domain-containing protein [Candidatus Omnitrophota bacterium]
MIELRHINKTYRMGTVDVHALRDVSLTIRQGEFVAIIGASGSGKSTLMHTLGLLDRPESGEYILGGQDVGSLSDDQWALLRNKHIGFVFQQFHLLPRMSALANVTLPLIYGGSRRSHDKARLRLKEVGLQDRESHCPNELSGGQQQRVAIARSLINDPWLLMADEPTGNLDSKSKSEIMGLFKALHSQGKTVILVTHEPEIAAQAGRIITMRDGQIVSDQIQPGNVADPVAVVELEEVKAVDVSIPKDGRSNMQFLDYMRQAIFAMLAHKMRAFLSILGILIGVAAVIAMVAIGLGAQESIKTQLASLGSNLLMVRPGSSHSGGVSLGAGAYTRFTFQDGSAIAKLSDSVSNVCPSVTGHIQLVYGGKNWSSQLEGVGPSYEEVRAAKPVAGRFFTAEEVTSRAKVALLGTTVVKQLFGDDDPVGQTLKINRVNFTVIGVLPSRGASPFRDQDDLVVIPVTTAMYRILGKQYIDSFYVQAIDPNATDQAQQEVQDALAKQHHLTAKEATDAFQVRNMSDIKQAMESSTKTMGMLLGAIAAISLLVGGIGIMNIMLVSVTERTREIGLRKALGANNHDIMTQFLIESVLMSLIGGVAGILVGIGASLLITWLAGWAVKVSLSSILIATAFSALVGLAFGLWPARQASSLNPIEALRYE